MHAAKMSKLCVSAQWLRKLALASCQPDGNLLCARLTPVIHSKSPPTPLGTASGSLEGSVVASSVQSDSQKAKKEGSTDLACNNIKKNSILETLPAVSSELPPKRKHSFQLLSWITFASQNHPVWGSFWKATGHKFSPRPSIWSLKDSNTTTN